MEKDNSQVPELTGSQLARLRIHIADTFSIFEFETATLSAIDKDLELYSSKNRNRAERVSDLLLALRGDGRLGLLLKTLFYKSGPERESQIEIAWEEIVPDFKKLFPDEPSEDVIRQSGIFQVEATTPPAPIPLPKKPRWETLLVNIGTGIAVLSLAAGILAYLSYQSPYLFLWPYGVWDWTARIAMAVAGLSTVAFAWLLASSKISNILRERRLHRVGTLDAIGGGSAGQPNFILRPYETSEAADFEKIGRADDAHVKVLSTLRSMSGSLLWVTGTSGTGKSSLINAGVIPALVAEGWHCVSLRIDRDPANRIAAALLSRPELFDGPQPKPQDGLFSILRAASNKAEKCKRPVLIVIDQFEEFLTFRDEGGSESHSELASALRDLARSPLPALRIICAFRIDYREHLFRLDLPAPLGGQDEITISAFSRKHAQEFLKTGFPDLKDEQFNRLFEGLDGIDGTSALYRPITLNMVGLMLDRMRGQVVDDPRKLTSLIERYIKDCLNQEDVRDHARKVLDKLISASAIRKPHDVSELSEKTGLNDWQVKGTLTGLELQGLVRRLQGDMERWEISHDFLARILVPLMGRHRPNLTIPAAQIGVVTGSILITSTVYLDDFYRDNRDISRIIGELNAESIGYSVDRNGNGQIRDLRNQQWSDYKIEFLSRYAGSIDFSSIEINNEYSRFSDNELEMEQNGPVTSIRPLLNFGIKYLTIREGGRNFRQLTFSDADNILQSGRLLIQEGQNESPKYFIEDLTPISHMPITNLSLFSVRNIKNYNFLKNTILTSLHLYDMPAYPIYIDNVSKLNALHLPKTNIKILSSFRGAPIEDITYCGEELDSRYHFVQSIKSTLKEIAFYDCEKLPVFDDFIGIDYLWSVRVESHRNSGNLDFLKNVKRIFRLTLRDLKKEFDISGIRGVEIGSVDLANSSGIVNLSPLDGIEDEAIWNMDSLPEAVIKTRRDPCKCIDRGDGLQPDWCEKISMSRVAPETCMNGLSSVRGAQGLRPAQ